MAQRVHWECGSTTAGTDTC